MHGLPKNIDLDFLKEKKLEQVCISSHQIILKFDEDISISIESVIKFFSSNGEEFLIDDLSEVTKEFLGSWEINRKCNVRRIG